MKTKKTNPKSTCYDCGLDYDDSGWIEAIIPDKVWNLIRPDGCAEGCGLLCITCISRRLAERGYKDVPVWLCGMEPLIAMAGDPNDNLNVLRNWKPSKNKNKLDKIQVCDSCHRASCWQGIFMCENSKNAGTTYLTRSELGKLELEHPCYWKTDEELA